MKRGNQQLQRLVVVTLLAALLLSGCGSKDKKKDEPKSYNVGVLIQTQGLVPVFDGFKAGMATLGYTDGQTIIYTYNGLTNTIDALEPEAQKLKGENLDLLLAIGTPPAQTAKRVFEGSKVPILFVPVLDPIGEGFVENFAHPGGHMTGINGVDTVNKALEWLIEIVPSAKRIYVPYDPKDGAGVKSLQTLTDTAATLGAELVVAEGPTPDELDSITQTIPENIDAVFALRSAAIGSRITNLVQAATARGIPVVTGDIGSRIDSGALLGYGPGYYEMGQQAASLAEKLLKGGKPAELPVEASETYLGINLQTADTLGIEISDEVLKQAKQVVHAP